MSYKPADHLTTPRIGYTHHGLYVGDGFVVEKGRNGVNLVSLDEFSGDSEIDVVRHFLKRKFTRKESVNRAYSRLGEDEYNVVFDNCEHFVNWCIFGIETSGQVQRAAMASFVAMEHMCCLPGQVVVEKYLSDNSEVLRVVAQRAGSIPANSVLAKALQSLGGVDGAGAVIKTALPGIGMGTSTAITAGAAATSSGTTSLIAGGMAGVGAAAGTAALTGGAAAGAAGVAAGVGAATVATVAAPLAIGVGVAVGVKKLWDWFTD